MMGTMGVAPNLTGKPNSIPPGEYGGNLDIRYLTAGAALYLPVQVAGGMSLSPIRISCKATEKWP
jgi:acetamidase/formamidase